jgi:hypothetical protein
MAIVWALANPKIGEREVLASMLETDAGLVAEREGILLISHLGQGLRVRLLIPVGKQRLESLGRGDGLLEAVRRGPARSGAVRRGPARSGAVRCGPVPDQHVDLLDAEFAEDAAPPGEAVAPTAVVNAFRVGCGCSGR